MCIPGLFVKLPQNKNNIKILILDNRSLKEVLKESFAHKGFRLLILGFFVCGFQITLIATHVPRYVQDKGLADWTGMAILALIGFFNIIGTLVMGYLGDKYSKKILLSGLYFLRGITLILFIFLPASNLICNFIWNFFWIIMACYCSSNKWYSCSNFWNKKFNTSFLV